MGMLQDPVQYYPDSEIKKRHHFQTITSPQHPGIAQTWKTFGELWG